MNTMSGNVKEMLAGPEVAIEPGQTRIGWIGTGVMGQSMCGHLLKAGYEVTLTSRTKSKAESLLANGGRWQAGARAVAENSDVIITMLGFPDEVREVILGANGVLSAAQPGSIVVDMTTSQPAIAKEIYQAAQAKGIYSLDAPVSGGDIGAREARLSIMVGGDESAFNALQPVWKTLGRMSVYQGAAGAGQNAKMVNQILIATGMIGVCEALLYAYRAGLDLETALKSVSSGAAGSWSLENYGPRILVNNFDPGFFVEHFIKDMDIALAEAKAMNIALPGLALAQQLYISLKAQGHGRKGTHALQLALANLSGIDWQHRD